MIESRMPLTQTRAWAKLKGMATLPVDVRAQFSSDQTRSQQMSVQTPKIWMDYSRQLMTPAIKDALVSLADETKLANRIEAMFRGEKINTTENRAVLHTALRNLSGEPVYVNGKDVMPEVKTVLESIKKFSESVLSGEWKGITGKKIRNIVSIGIGGSYLGPEYLAIACEKYAKEGMTLRFVANVDNTDFVTKTKDLDPAETLFVVVSKTFGTLETIKNAETAKAWVKKALGSSDDVIKKHFVAVSTAAEKVASFGIDTKNMFGFWDWVGGRFSATSAVGALPLSLYLGYDNFHKILEGAYWMDKHFRHMPFEKNIPVMSALVDIWNINFLDKKTRVILPYAQSYERYAAHCQQTEMESNGKSVDLDGNRVEYATGEKIFGEPGTNGQHSFYQLIHQSELIIPCDFIGFMKGMYQDEYSTGLTQHEELMMNFFAQPDALMEGKTADQVREDLMQKYGKVDERVVPHMVFSGNKPSSVYMLAEQDPFTAGLMLAFLEHRVAAKGFIWNINSFDQFGVELGKALALGMRARTTNSKIDPNGPAILSGLNQSTNEMYSAFLKGSLG